jgi:hypothetical protein
MRTGTRSSTCVGLSFSLMISMKDPHLREVRPLFPSYKCIKLDIIPGDASLGTLHIQPGKCSFLTTETTSLTKFLSFIFVMMSILPCIVG